MFLCWQYSKVNSIYNSEKCHSGMLKKNLEQQTENKGECKFDL